MFENIFLVISIFLLILNLFVSYKLFKDDSYNKKQKFFQVLIIWFIPLFGSLLVNFFLNKNIESNNPYSGGIDSPWNGGNEYSSSDGGSSGGDLNPAFVKA